jgi:hypothetical protein
VREHEAVGLVAVAVAVAEVELPQRVSIREYWCGSNQRKYKKRKMLTSAKEVARRQPHYNHLDNGSSMLLEEASIVFLSPLIPISSTCISFGHG